MIRWLERVPGLGAREASPARPAKTSARLRCSIPCMLSVLNTIVLTKALRRTIKFLHTLGAVGFMGGMAALAVVVITAPVGASGYAPLIGGTAKVAAWLVAPSMILTVVSGLLAMLMNPAFYEALWVWVKAATGILILEGGLHVLGPLQDEAKRVAATPDAHANPASVASLLAAEGNTLWVLLAVSAANIALGVWRPRLPKI